MENLSKAIYVGFTLLFFSLFSPGNANGQTAFEKKALPISPSQTEAWEEAQSVSVLAVGQENGSDCEAVPLNMEESFEEDAFPPLCWESESDDNAPWKRVNGGTYPNTCKPQDGGAMIQYNCYSYSKGKKGTVATPAFITGGKDRVLSFWMYRDKEYPSSTDRVNVYFGATTEIAGKEPVLTVNRSMALAPEVAAEGWRQYVIQLPCTSMETAYIVFEGISDNGNNIYIDNITIGDYCYSPSQASSSLYGSTNPLNQVRVAWEKPVATFFHTGYAVYRNGALIANNLTGMEYADEEILAPGNYVYSVVAIYDNACGLSEETHASTVTVTELCPGLPIPENLEVKPVADEWFGVELSWEYTVAGDTISYISGEPGGAVSGGQSYRSFAAGIRFSPDELEGYGGRFLTKINFIPFEKNTNYILQVWQGSDGNNPGAKVHEQALNTDDLQTLGLVVNEILLTSSIPIDAAQDMWIVVVYESLSSYEAPAIHDQGPTAKDGYSNMVCYKGEWLSLLDMSSDFNFNWSISGTVEDIMGFNVYCNEELANKEGIIKDTFYYTVAPQPGKLSYEVSAVYSDYCETMEKAQQTIHIDDPCPPATAAKAEVVEEATVQVSWTAPEAEGVLSYSIYRNEELLTETDQSPYRDEAVPAGRYTYSIVVNYEGKPYPASAPATTGEIVIEPCTPVSNLEGVYADEKITLTWEHQEEEAYSFEVYRNETLLSTTDEQTFVDEEIEADMSYNYCVRPVYQFCPADDECVLVETLSVLMANTRADNIHIYPNPASTQVVVSGNMLRLEIYDMHGRLVESRKPDQEMQTVVDVTSYSLGVYLLRIYTPDNSYTTRSLIINR